MGLQGTRLPPEPYQPLLATSSPSPQTPERCCFHIAGRAAARRTQGTAGCVTGRMWGSAGCAAGWTRHAAGFPGRREAARHLPAAERSQREAPASCTSLPVGVSQDGCWLGGSSRELQPPHHSPTHWPLLSSSRQGPAGTEGSARPHLQEAAALQSHESHWSVCSDSVLVTH